MDGSPPNVAPLGVIENMGLFGSQTAPPPVTPRVPSDELMTPMCMLCTGGNSMVPMFGGHTPLVDWAMTWVIPMESGAEMQLGCTRRVTRSGTAAARKACLSPIDAEL